MPRYVCIHGHFYQPPRENPWLEKVELQESAAPWHDWNSRITAECYLRNSASRILDRNGDIRKICNNYSRMSFNIGPTLLSWMQEEAPRCYQAILEADKLGQKRFSGHGPALAQVYNHIIMPLAGRQDKVTQVRWGIEDFKTRFGRQPEGMWLAETAVDTETLEVLAENGILFTILAPKQAAEVRLIGATSPWVNVRGEKVDTGRAYLCALPSGKSITLFFYDGQISQAIAFGGLLNNGENYAHQLVEARHRPGQPTLSHVATDGESYGHHHDNGDMALAYCLETIDNGIEANLTIYGEFMSFYPPEHYVKIVENSSWSCAHGIERWRSDCGCSDGTKGHHQKWRAPLREALDWLKKQCDAIFEAEAGKLLNDPWVARDSYIKVILNRSPENVTGWINQHAKAAVSQAERTRILQLMELERAALLMYTSCGWFFDDVARIETIQILRYAARAVELAQIITDVNYDAEFMKLLEKVPGNLPEFRNGERVYSLLAKSSRLSPEQMAAQCGIMSLFPEFPKQATNGSWETESDISTVGSSLGGEKSSSSAFSYGTVRVRSRITEEESIFLIAANYRSGISVICGVKPENAMRRVPEAEGAELRKMFAGSDSKAMIDMFRHNLFSLRHILLDSQRSLLDKLLKWDVAKIEKDVRSIVRDYDQLLEYMTTLEVRPPSIISIAAEIALTANVVHILESEAPGLEDIRRHLKLAQRWKIKVDNVRIGFLISDWLKLQMESLHSSPDDLPRIENILNLLNMFIDECGWHLSLYDAQNIYCEIRKVHYNLLKKAGPAIRSAFHMLGRRLKFSEESLSEI